MNYRNIVIQFLFDRDGPNCQFCGESFVAQAPPSIDHKVPQIKGGSDQIGNLQLLHDRCNTKKGAVLASELTGTELAAILQLAKDRGPKPIPEMRRVIADEAVQKTGGSKGKAAKLLGIDTKTLYRWRKTGEKV